MKIYLVTITEDAYTDIQNIYWYLANIKCVPEIALSLTNRIFDAIDSLSTFPMRVQIMNSEPAHSLKFRKLVVGNYAVLFRVLDEEVQVMNVLHNSMDIDAKLKRKSFF